MAAVDGFNKWLFYFKTTGTCRSEKIWKLQLLLMVSISGYRYTTLPTCRSEMIWKLEAISISGYTTLPNCRSDMI
jgi:hypothetical protein